MHSAAPLPPQAAPGGLRLRRNGAGAPRTSRGAVGFWCPRNITTPWKPKHQTVARAAHPQRRASTGVEGSSGVRHHQDAPVTSETAVMGPDALRAPPHSVGPAQADAMAAPAWWAAIPSRYKLLFATSLSFVICNMDKVNMSVAIIPMAADFGWSPSVSGVVQASFFYGYLLCQLPGGWITSAVGGRRVLPAGVALWSAMTCAVPGLGSTVGGLCAVRAAVGLGEAVAPSAATDMIARVVPVEERSSAVSLVFGGLHVGSMAGLLAAPALIQACGWESVFIVFGAAGLAWVAGYEALLSHLRAVDPDFVARLNPPKPANPGRGVEGLAASSMPPCRAFVASGPVRALAFTHFCHNWMSYTMLAWLPTYFVQTLSVDLMHAAATALLPPAAGIAAAALAGPTADALITRARLPLPVVRKGVQALAFLVPCAALVALFMMDAAGEDGDPATTVALITAALGMSNFSLAGLYCTHQDMSPKYASALLGLTNTTGAIPGIVGVATVGWLLDMTGGSWGAALFAPSAVCMVAGALAYTFGCRNDPIDFDALAAQLADGGKGRGGKQE